MIQQAYVESGFKRFFSFFRQNRLEGKWNFISPQRTRPLSLSEFSPYSPRPKSGVRRPSPVLYRSYPPPSVGDRRPQPLSLSLAGSASYAPLSLSLAGSAGSVHRKPPPAAPLSLSGRICLLRTSLSLSLSLAGSACSVRRKPPPAALCLSRSLRCRSSLSLR